MLIFKCPECEDSTMGFNESEHSWVCSDQECQHELSEEEADTLFESGDLVALVESAKKESEDEYDDEDEDEMDDEEDDDEEDMEEGFNGFANRETWMTNLVINNEYALMKKAIEAIAESEDAQASMIAFAKKELFTNENFTSLMEDYDVDNIEWDEIVEGLKDTLAEMAEIRSDLEGALSVDEALNEEEKAGIVTVFEAALTVRYNELKNNLEEKYAVELEEASQANKEYLTKEMSEYLDIAIAEWKEENALALEHACRTQMTESFMDGLKVLFEKHYIDVPEGRYDVLEDMADKIEEMESQIAESKAEKAELQKQLDESKKEAIIVEMREGLADTQVEKLSELAGSVNYESEEQFKSELTRLKESFLKAPKNRKEGDTVITETIESDDAKKTNKPASFAEVVRNAGKK